MLTDRGLIETFPHLGGVRRKYDLGKGYGLSAINGSIIHYYSFAWEIGVLFNGDLCYDTPLTNDVEVFMTDEEANAFIEKAFAWVQNKA